MSAPAWVAVWTLNGCEPSGVQTTRSRWLDFVSTHRISSNMSRWLTSGYYWTSTGQYSNHSAFALHWIENYKTKEALNTLLSIWTGYTNAYAIDAVKHSSIQRRIKAKKHKNSAARRRQSSEKWKRRRMTTYNGHEQNATVVLNYRHKFTLIIHLKNAREHSKRGIYVHNLSGMDNRVCWFSSLNVQAQFYEQPRGRLKRRRHLYRCNRNFQSSVTTYVKGNESS